MGLIQALAKHLRSVANLNAISNHIHWFWVGTFISQSKGGILMDFNINFDFQFQELTIVPTNFQLWNLEQFGEGGPASSGGGGWVFL